MHKPYCHCEGTGKIQLGNCPIQEDDYKDVIGFKIRVDGIPFQGEGWIIHLTDKDGDNIDECSKEFAQFLGHDINDAIAWGKSVGLEYQGIFHEEDEDDDADS
jgi:hypothetical protein